jgi:uncharacterized phage-associated protein
VANVHDVAAYILSKRSPMTAMKLQKLVYYSQAWSLVWEDAPLFPERIEAWANGPVVRELYEQHRGMFLVRKLALGNPDALDEDERGTVDAVLAFYGNKPSQWLSDLTHQEAPWREARTGIAPGAFSDREITAASMAEFYGSLAAK